MALEDDTAIIIASVIAGVAGGFISSWMAFNSSGQKFDGRKHGNALITGALSGIALGIATAVAAPDNMTQPQIAIMLFTIFLSTAGIDRLRSSGTKMTVKADTSKPAVTAATTTTTPPPATTTPPPK